MPIFKEEESLYIKNIINSFKIIWKNKFFWFFGLFISVLGATWEYDEVIKKLFSNDVDEKISLETILINIYDTGLFSSESLFGIPKALSESFFGVFIIFFIFIAIFALIAFMIWMSIVSQAGFCYSLYQIKERGASYLKEGFVKGHQKFWEILSINILGRIITLALIALSVFLITKTRFSWLITTLACITILSALIISLIMKYAINFAVHSESKNPFKHYISGIKLFFSNFLISSETIITLFAVDIIVKWVAGFITIIFFTTISPIANLSLKLSPNFSFNFNFIFVPTLLVVITIFFIMILTAIHYSISTLLFIELNINKKSKSALARITEKLKNSLKKNLDK